MGNQETIDRAIEHLDLHALAKSVLPEIAIKFKEMPKLDLNNQENREERARAEVTLARVLYAEGRITKAEYMYFRAMPLISHVFESRWQDGAYVTEIGPLAAEMKQIEKKHGLTEDEFWFRGKGPDEYEALNVQYDEVLDKKQGEVFIEFGQNDLAELWEANKQQFLELFEKGRKAIFESQDIPKALQELADEYEREAGICEKQNANYAGCALLGAAMEARLLLKCITNLENSRIALNALPSDKRPKSKDPLTWSLVHLLSICSAAGWLPPFEGEVATHVPESWGHRLRQMRNLLHPGKHVQDRPRACLGEEEFEDARAMYTLVVNQLQKSADTDSKS
jgi:hypothetical protein